MAETRTRPGRSHSLQRMLEAEKRCMLERLQGLPSAPTPPYMASATSVASSTASRMSSPSRNPAQARPNSDMPAKKAQSSSANTRHTSPAPQLPPLVIPALPLTAASKPGESRPRQDPRSAIIQSVAVASPNIIEKEKRTPKAVAFDIADDQGDKRSLCSSPSWDAYDRRKKAKKAEKKEKGKERIQMSELAQTQEKKRRLSKVPPQSSSHALKVAGQMAATQHKQQKQQKQRPSSALGLATPVKVEAPVTAPAPTPRPRSRSGSFTSLIKSPFTSRRSSMDQTTERVDSAFIGGIKLEIQKHAAYQKVIEAQAAQSTDGDAHTALRTFRSSQTWSYPTSTAAPPLQDEPQPQPVKAEPTTSSLQAPKLPPSEIETTRAVPPAPPRRSSKRNSLLSLNGSALDLSYPSEGSSDGSVSGRTKPRGEYLNIWGDPSRYSQPNSIQCSPKCSPKLSPRMIVNSSDDSCSEQFHSPSQPSTPDTSRPPSEKGVTPLFGDFDKRFMLDNQVKQDHRGEDWPFKAPLQASPQASSNSSKDYDRFVMAPEKPEDVEMDQIQAAAEKVLADYAMIPRGRPSVNRRSCSESNVVTGATLPLRLREKNVSRESAPLTKQSVVEGSEGQPPMEIRFSIDPRAESSLSPATYLEAARTTLSPAATSSHPSPVLPSTAENTPRVMKLRNSSPAASQNTAASGTNPTHVSDSTPKAKVFVECCGCKYYHDMPSHLYEAMTNPERALKTREKLAFAGAVSMTVKCPWCKHEMSTRCCAGFAAMVYVQERLH